MAAQRQRQRAPPREGCPALPAAAWSPAPLPLEPPLPRWAASRRRRRRGPAGAAWATRRPPTARCWALRGAACCRPATAAASCRRMTRWRRCAATCCGWRANWPPKMQPLQRCERGWQSSKASCPQARARPRQQARGRARRQPQQRQRQRRRRRRRQACRLAALRPPPGRRLQPRISSSTGAACQGTGRSPQAAQRGQPPASRPAAAGGWAPPRRRRPLWATAWEAWGGCRGSWAAWRGTAPLVPSWLLPPWQAAACTSRKRQQQGGRPASSRARSSRAERRRRSSTARRPCCGSRARLRCRAEGARARWVARGTRAAFRA